jgi:hypothetical protein
MSNAEDFCFRDDGDDDFFNEDDDVVEELISVFEFVGPVVVFNIFDLATDDKIVDERLLSCSVIVLLLVDELLLFNRNRS